MILVEVVNTLLWLMNLTSGNNYGNGVRNAQVSIMTTVQEGGVRQEENTITVGAVITVCLSMEILVETKTSGVGARNVDYYPLMMVPLQTWYVIYES